jgi:hypothetical protein
MVVGYEVIRLALLLQLDGGPHHSEKIPDMKTSGGLDAA